MGGAALVLKVCHCQEETHHHFKPTETLTMSGFHPLTTLSSSSHKFIFPAKNKCPTHSNLAGTRKTIISSSANTSTTDDCASSEDGFCDINRRRGLILMGSLPFLLTLNGCLDASGVNAAMVGSTSYPIIQEGLRKVVSKGKAAGVLRLVFHDAGTFDMNDNSGGMNGSIVYELDRPENAGLGKSLKILEKVKGEIDETKPDMIAVAGAEAVSICGGPEIPVQLGRIDSMKPDPEGRLPEESLDAPGLKQNFLRKGFSTQELVALSGAHTLGNKGFGSPTVFDNSYFKILLEKPWGPSGGMTSMIGLPSDRTLPEDDECLSATKCGLSVVVSEVCVLIEASSYKIDPAKPEGWIKTYADNQATFFEDFKKAYIKLVNSGASWKKV